ncbi:hypothetical protein GCM10027168_11880 [Streptomyces capparidis]
MHDDLGSSSWLGSAWSIVARLPFDVDGVRYRSLHRKEPVGSPRVTSVAVLSGRGASGAGEDVSPIASDTNTWLHLAPPDVELRGSWTIESFGLHLDEQDLWPHRHPWPTAVKWRRWAFEAAAFDLALRQNDVDVGELLGRRPRPVRFVNSVRLDRDRPFDLLRQRRTSDPDLLFKIDVESWWTPELIRELRTVGGVSILDFKGRSGAAEPVGPRLMAIYEECLGCFPEAILEDPHDASGISRLVDASRTAVSFDAPVGRAWAPDREAIVPSHINVKPCRFGSLAGLFSFYGRAAGWGTILYGGGMDELGVGRGQIQQLAALLHPDSPNDVAPSEYNQHLVSGLPPSPLGVRRGKGFG